MYYCTSAHYDWVEHLVSVNPALDLMENSPCSRQSRTLLKKLSALLAENWEKVYSEICGYGNAWISIAMVRANHIYLQDSCIPMRQMINRRPQGGTRLAWGFSRGKIPSTRYFSLTYPHHPTLISTLKPAKLPLTS
jgi:hypothetical protein